MGLAAHLYRDARWAERHQVERDATLRDPEWSPIDAIVDDLSESGFRVTSSADLAIGAEVALGLSGIGTHSARIVRRAGDVYGCEFLTPLTAAQLGAALAAPSAAPIALPRTEAAAAAPLETIAFAEEEHPDRLPMPVRLATIAFSAVAAWAILIGFGWILVSLVRSILTA